jgi:hypothetical protein
MAFNRNFLTARLSQLFPGEEGRILGDLFAALSDNSQTIANSVTAMANKLNADAGVTDTNYVGPVLPPIRTL